MIAEHGNTVMSIAIVSRLPKPTSYVAMAGNTTGSIAGWLRTRGASELFLKTSLAKGRLSDQDNGTSQLW
jgi:membrane protein YqaA with SNARE-associated domain